MRENWKYQPLGDIVEIKRGLTYSKNDEVDISGKIVLRSNNVNLDNHQFDFTELKYLKPTFDIPSDKYLQKGDLLMCMSNGSKAHLGKVALYDGESDKYAFGGFMAALSHKDSVIGRYLFYAMITPMYKEYIKTLSDGANINNLKVRDIEAFSIPVPPLSEQERIVALLDDQFAKIDALKANADQQLKAAKDLFQSALKEMLTPKEGWEIGNVGSIATILHGKNQKEVEALNGKYPIYGSGGNIMGYANEYLCEEGTTILGRKGTINNPIYIAEKFWNVDTAFGICAKDGVNKRFLYYIIKSINWQEKNTGTTLPSLTQTVVLSVPISFPSLSEQERIAARLDAISEKVKALQDNYDQTINLCNDLKQALLKSIFE